MVDVQQATSIDVAITVVVGRTEEGSGGLDWRSDGRSPGGGRRRPAAYLALRGVARWCPTCGAGLRCLDCNQSRTGRPSGNAPGRSLNQGTHGYRGRPPLRCLDLRVTLADALRRRRNFWKRISPDSSAGAVAAPCVVVTGPCGPYEIAMSVFVGLGTLPRRPPFASHLGGPAATARRTHLMSSMSGGR